MTVLSITLGGVAAALIFLVATATLLLRPETLTLARRLSLAAIAGSLLLSAPEAFDKGWGLFPALVLCAVAAHVLVVYGPALWRKADELDGKVDGQVNVSRFPSKRRSVA